MIRVIRWALTAWLLFFVWMHSHWSVAASLTLLFLAQELDSVVTGRIIATVKEIVKILKESR